MPAPVHEVVIELAGGAATPAGVAGEAPAAALLRIPGVVEAHVDDHLTWAMVSFHPSLTGIAAIGGCLAAHGLAPFRVRRLVTDSDACE